MAGNGNPVQLTDLLVPSAPLVLAGHIYTLREGGGVTLHGAAVVLAAGDGTSLQ